MNDPEQGIVHVISPELGLALPGQTFICGDSHTCTIGGLGALAWGIGITQGEHALADRIEARGIGAGRWHGRPYARSRKPV